MKPISSAISGLPSLEQEASSSTGQQLGAVGFGGLEKARDRLINQTPRETDQNLLAWLASSLNVVANPRESFRFPAKGGYYAVIEGFDFEGLTPSNRSRAIEAVQAAMTRPTTDQAEEWIAGLSAVTAQRSQSDDASEIALTLYTARLGMYPADVLKQVCLDFALRREKPNWFPTLSEMDEACEKLTNKRRALLKALA